MTTVRKPSQRRQLERLAAFLPMFEDRGFRFGTVCVPSPDESGVLQMGYVEMSPGGEAFFKTAYDDGWVLSDFDWPSWTETSEAQTLLRERDALAAATPDQLFKLLTVVIRQDRFCEGSLLEAYENGFLTAIVRRAHALVHEATGRTR